MYLGIDVGGTNLKAGLVDENGTILAQEHTPLGVFPGPEGFALRLAELSRAVLKRGGASEADVASVGIGIPGAVSGCFGGIWTFRYCLETTLTVPPWANGSSAQAGAPGIF